MNTALESGTDEGSWRNRAKFSREVNHAGRRRGLTAGNEGKSAPGRDERRTSYTAYYVLFHRRLLLLLTLSELVRIVPSL